MIYVIIPNETIQLNTLDDFIRLKYEHDIDISSDIKIKKNDKGDRVLYVKNGVSVHHGCIFGSDINLEGGCTVGSNCKIGENVTVS